MKNLSPVMTDLNADLTIACEDPNNMKLHPYFLTGFTDGDGSFMVQVFRTKTK